MEYQIKFHPAALHEFCKLDGSIKRKREDMEVYADAAERIPKFQKGKSQIFRIRVAIFDGHFDGE